MNFEASFAGKVSNFISLYRLPSQSHDIFETFADNLELNLDTIANENPYLIVILVTSMLRYQIGLNTIKPLINALKLKL